MKIQELYDHMSIDSAVVYQFDENADFVCVKILTADIELSPSDILLGKVQDFVSLGIPLHTRQMVCLGNPDPIMPQITADRINCLYLPSFRSETVIFNKISEAISLSLSMRHGTELLFRSVKNGKHDMNVDSVIDTICELTNNPSILFSENGDIIAFRNLDLIYPDLLSNRNLSLLSDAFLSFMEANREWHDSYLSIQEFWGAEIHSLLGKIRGNEKTAAYLMVFEYNPFSDAQTNLFPVICSWLAQEIRHGNFIISPDNNLAAKFLNNLLDKRISSDDLIKQQAQKLKLDKYGFYYILIVDLFETDIRHGSPRSVGDLLEHTILNGIVTARNNRLIALINSREGQAKDAIGSKEFDHFLSSINGTCGVSYAFHHLKQVTVAYYQALRSIEYGKVFDEGGKLFFYNDVVIYDMLENCGKNEDTMNYCLPQLLDLMEHDRQNNTQYTYTLYILILTGGKQTPASKALGIHRTTMQYRVEKIMEKTGLDITDAYNVLRLYISYGILIQNGKLDPEIYYQL